jgi:hypothetical protein
MKQIFDWLREQTQEALASNKLRIGLGMKLVSPYACFIDIINEAEAKWEKDCCEQKWNKEDWWYDTSCGHILEPHSYNFCPYCGKRLKISGVD